VSIVDEPRDGDAVTPAPALDRAGLVRRTVKEWVTELIDLGGRNNLLHYRDLRTGTLALDAANDDAMTTLLRGRTTRISRLFPDEETRADAIRRARAVHRKAKENYEERGISTLYVACGIATWTNIRTWEPAAPVLLIPALVEPMGAALDDFELSVAGDPEINPTLLHMLKVDYDCDIRVDELLGIVDGPIDEPWEIQATIDWLGEAASRVPGFSAGPRFTLANFSYAKLPMVRDLESSEAELVSHDLIAALSGDPGARENVRALGPAADAVPSAEIPAADEFLVLDADSSQSYAINAVLGGQNLIVRGPPGTGKSQSIANLIGALVARGKRVLFVAEKRAAIDAVLKRLRSTGLNDLVLDLHGRIVSRKAFAQGITQALNTSRSAPRVDRSREQRRLDRHRLELNSYAAALHLKREPWDISVYDIQADLLRLGPVQSYKTRFQSAVLDKLRGETLEQAATNLEQLAVLDGLSISRSSSAWAHSPITSSAAASEAFELLDAIRSDALPAAVEAFSSGVDESQTEMPSTLGEGQGLLTLWEGASRMSTVVSPSLYSADLESLTALLATARKGMLRRVAAGLFSGPYRAARAHLRQHVLETKTSDTDLHAIAINAMQVRDAWRAVTVAPPTAPSNLERIREAARQLRDGLAQLETATNRSLRSANFDELPNLLYRLAEDRATLSKLPEIHRLKTALNDAGLRDMLSEIESQTEPEKTALQAFEWVWLKSILDRVLLADPAIGSVSGEALDGVVEAFMQEDQEHVETTADRIRRIAAERATAARDAYPDQSQLVHRQATLKRGHMPVRKFVQGASDVLLALKPCWAMSPLMVSQLLPTRKYFDVVVFDEASQVTPADAATSILRGEQLVVAGDERQLPPTAFFASEATGETEEQYTDDEDGLLLALSGTKGFESILDALNSLFPARMLQWHYRSRDERLIAFSNAFIYDKMLTTFPGIGGGPCIEQIEVPWEPGSDTNSPAAEVRRVVDLILEHAAAAPHLSLGVIAMGIRHANRIEEWLRERLQGHPELDAFFAEDREEPFFVKNLERVQGDERDAIILTMGYGKNDRGQMLYRFGPLLMAGGERRLNVAVTRAKRQMTLVSSFAPGDLDPDRLNSEGMKLLRSYHLYAASGGTDLGPQAASIPQLNPFEADVRDTLSARGLRLEPQYGASGFRIDFAVRHPDHPGRFILAIECDGASFHSAASARDRDRLRQEQLERIGWRFHRIWSSEWFHNKDAAVEKVLKAYEQALFGPGGAPNAEAAFEAREPNPEYPQAVGRGDRPNIPAGWKIDEYWGHQLIAIIDWIESDELLRTEEELIVEAMAELGFQRRGARIVGVLRWAIREARAARKPTPARPVPRRRPAVATPPEAPLAERAPFSLPPPPSDPAEYTAEVVRPIPEPGEEPAPDDGWDAGAERTELATIKTERSALEALRGRLPAEEYMARLHELLARSRKLADARRLTTARVADGRFVTLEGPDGTRSRSKISRVVVMHATRDGWIEPGGSDQAGISVYSDLGKAILGAKIGDVRLVDGVGYTVVDIEDR
jgi:very-short-patch-repair endonuclease/transcription elongation GreA/GreB family factor